MNYINTELSRYPFTYAYIVATFPTTSFPPPEDFTPPAPFAKVIPNDVKPDFIKATQQVLEDFPVLVDGEWHQTWKVIEIFATQAERDASIAAAAAADSANLQAGIVKAAQKRLDDFAKTRSYDSILSAVTYAASPVPKFAQEGQYALTARDNTWNALYNILAEVEAGTRPVPTGFINIEPLLPALAWPA